MDLLPTPSDAFQTMNNLFNQDLDAYCLELASLQQKLIGEGKAALVDEFNHQLDSLQNHDLRAFFDKRRQIFVRKINRLAIDPEIKTVIIKEFDNYHGPMVNCIVHAVKEGEKNIARSTRGLS